MPRGASFSKLGDWALTTMFWLTRTHSLRYVLKNRETDRELLVVSIQLLPTEQAKEQGVADPASKLDEVHGAETTKGEADDDLD